MNIQNIIFLIVVLIIIITCTVVIYFNEKNRRNKENFVNSNIDYDSIITINDNFQMSTLSFPTGMIISYYNPKPSENIKIPYGWVLCDGTNDTPDLRGRFVIGYSQKHPFGTTGGTDTQKLSINHIPEHSHGFPVTAQSCASTSCSGQQQCDNYKRMSSCPDVEIPAQKSIKSKDNNGGKTFSTMPPYFSMIFIMKNIKSYKPNEIKNKEITPPVQQPVLPPPQKIKLNETISKETPTVDNCGGNTVCLDRHNLDCGSKGVIRRLQFKNTVDGKAKYEYTCSNLLEDRTRELAPQNTLYNQQSSNSAYLDRHYVNCQKGSISQVNLDRDGKGNFRYNYKCNLAPVADITTHSTPLNDDGGGNSAFLDRHNIRCPVGKVLTGFKMVDTGNQIQYNYRCGVPMDKIKESNNTSSYVLKSDNKIHEGNQLVSPNGMYKLNIKSDGNMSITDGIFSVWDNNIHTDTSEYYLYLHSDGNLVVIDNKKNTAVWKSGAISEIGNYYLMLHNDGRMRVYKGIYSLTNKNVLWSSKSRILHSNNSIESSKSNIDEIESLNKIYKLRIQTDGNLILLKNNIDLRRLGTSFPIGSKYYFMLNTDASITINKGNDIVWMRENPPYMNLDDYFLILDNRGLVSIYRGKGLSQNKGFHSFITIG